MPLFLFKHTSDFLFVAEAFLSLFAYCAVYLLAYDKGSVGSIRQLKSAALDSVSSLSAMGNGKEYKLAGNVQILLWDGLSSGACYLMNLSQINIVQGGPDPPGGDHEQLEGQAAVPEYADTAGAAEP